jgi:Trk K+ transport system NAD-binding subunit
MLAEIEVTSDSGLLGMYVRQLLEAVHVSLLGIQRRNGDLIVGPRDDVRLEDGDRVMVLGGEDEISKTWAARGAVLR